MLEAFHGNGPADIDKKTGSNAGHEHKTTLVATDDKSNNDSIDKRPSIVANIDLLLIERIGETNLSKNGRQIVAGSTC